MATASTYEDKIVTPRFVLLFIANFIVISTYFLLITTVARFTVTTYGAPDSLGGLAAAIFLIGAVPARILCARYLECLGIYRLTVISLVIETAASLLYFANSLGLPFFIGLRFLHGMGFGVANTVLPALAVDALPRDRIGEGTGYFMLSNSLGVGIGPILSILVVMGIDYNVLFAIVSIALFIALGISLMLSRKQIEPIGPRPGKFTLGSVVDLSTIKFSFFIFIVAFAFSSFNTYINSFAESVGMGLYAPFVFLVYSVALLATRPISGKIQDKRGENWVLYPAIISTGVALLVIAVSGSPVVLLSSGIFMAAGFGTCISAGQAAVAKLTSCSSSAIGISTFLLFCDAGGIGPFFQGFIITALGYRWMYVCCAGIAVIALVYYHFAHGKNVKSKQ